MTRVETERVTVDEREEREKKRRRGTMMGIVREGSTVSKRKPKGSGSKKRRKENIKEEKGKE